MCITIDIPVAQKFGLEFVPGIFFLNSFENFPLTSEKFTPTFSNTLPFSMNHLSQGLYYIKLTTSTENINIVIELTK